MAKRQKTGGRVKGTPNKSTAEMRSQLSSILSTELDKLPGYLKQLDPEKKIQVMIKLLPYILPVKEDPKEESRLRDGKAFIQRIYNHLIVDDDNQAQSA